MSIEPAGAMRRPSGAKWLAAVFAANLVLAVALLGLTGGTVQSAAAWGILILGIGSAWLVPVAYAAPAVVTLLTVHAWITQATGMAESGIPGANAATIVTVAGFGAYLVRFRWRGASPRPRRSAIVYLAISLLLVDALAEIRSFKFEAGVLAITVAAYARVACVFAWTFVVTRRFARLDVLRIALVVVLGPLMVGYSVFESVRTSDATLEAEISAARGGGLADPNYVMVGLVFALSLTMMAMLHECASRRLKALAVALLGSGMMFVMMSGSRTAAFSLLAGLLVLITLVGTRRILIMVAAIAVQGAVVWFLLPEWVRNRFTGIRDGYESARKSAYESALEAFVQFPVFGSGRDTYRLGLPSSTGAAGHNTYLTVLAEGGIVGGLVLVALVAVLLWTGIRAFRRTKDPAWAAQVSLVASGAVAGAGLSFAANDYCLTLFAAALAFILGAARAAERQAIASVHERAPEESMALGR